MMLAGLIAYQLFACGVVILVGYLGFQRTKRDLRSAADQVIADLQARAYTPPMPEPPQATDLPDHGPDAPSAVLLRIRCDDEELESVIDYLAGRGLHPAVVERQAS